MIRYSVLCVEKEAEKRHPMAAPGSSPSHILSPLSLADNLIGATGTVGSVEARFTHGNWAIREWSLTGFLASASPSGKARPCLARTPWGPVSGRSDGLERKSRL